jgi:RNA polymerase sigma factor (sigma-70 family)
VAQQSAEEIFTKIFRDHHDLVLAYCARRVSAHEADDATSEVFTVLWRRIREVDPERPLPWLYGVARNTLAHRWRSRGRWQRLLDRLGGSPERSTASTEEVVIRREQDRLVVTAVTQLSPTDQEILRLVAWEGLTAPECAETLGCSVAAAEQRLHRAKQRLARRLRSTLDSVPNQPVTQEGMS